MFRIGQEEIDAVAKVIQARKFFKINDGPQECKHFQEEMCELLGTKYSIFMTSGHAALSSALIALGIGPGDEVIVPAYTYIATAMAVIAAGAMPVVAEVDETLTLDAADVEKRITPRTKAIVPVHIQGFPSDMDALMAVAQKYNLYVVEDACQADGGSYKGKRLGTIGHAGGYSFNYYKVISCGEGGALVTNDKALHDKALIYHDSNAVAFFGDQLADVDVPPFCGSEYRGNEILAAIMRVQLKRMDGILEDNRANKKKLMEALADTFTFAPSHDIEGDCATTVALRFETEAEARRVQEIAGGTIPYDTGKHVYINWQAFIDQRGALHPAMDPFKMEANKDHVPSYGPEQCPKSLDLLARTLYIGIHPDMTDEEIQTIAAKYKAAMNA